MWDLSGWWAPFPHVEEPAQKQSQRRRKQSKRHEETEP